ncbi:MAG: MFS transporter [Acetobacteraceae bacterium]|nr:MFS transporter [Acetobacteraceae bacterium]
MAVFAWCLYDWAYSAFNTVVSTFVIATWFVRAVAIDPATGTAQWGATQAIAGVIIALASAPLGAIADRGGRRRAMLAVFTGVIVLATAALWFVHPTPADAMLALFLVCLATISYEIATVFYNSMLPDVAGPRTIGRVSGMAWGCGYVGGLVCLGLCLVVLINPDPPLFGLNRAQAEPIRATALFAAAWLAVFGWPVLAIRNTARPRPWTEALRGGLAELSAALRRAARHPGLLRFLLARMLYTDGLTTLFAFGGIYAAGTFGLDARGVLMLGIGLNITAGIGALSFAFLEDRIGAKTTILLSLAALVVLGLAALAAQSAAAFTPIALALGLFVGPAQAASRSLMARISPEESRNAHFGLYALSGRVTGFVGPAALSAVTAATGSQRAGMLVISILLTAGGVLLAATRVQSARAPL